MATVTTTRLIDDLDDTQEADETIDFGLDGRRYEIDLSSDNAERLRDVLRPFLDAARKAGGGAGRRTQQESGGRGRTAADKDRAAAIRAWVREHGGEIGDRGRIPQPFIEAFDRRDPSIFAKDADEDERPETDEFEDELDDDEESDEFEDEGEDSDEGEKVGAGSGVGDPFSTFTEPEHPHF